MTDKKRDFKLSSLALRNRTSVFLLTIVIAISGLMSYFNLPKELFPEVVIPYVTVQTIYLGNNPSDIENLVTRPLEREIDGIKGIKRLSSTSMQDFSLIGIEFNFDTDIKDALQDVKDAVDKARKDLPNDLPNEPVVEDVDFSEFPFINVNVTGHFSLDELKKYGDILEDEFKNISEISKIDIQGISDKEVRIEADAHRLEAFNINFTDIESAIQQENLSLGIGEVRLGETRRALRVLGEFTNLKQIRDVIVKQQNGKSIYLKDIADVSYVYEEASSYSRLGETPVISLQLVKKSGENVLSASEKVYQKIKEIRQSHLIPDDLEIVATNDQSNSIKKQLANLENSMILSMIFVVVVLFFFLGTRNALFVGLAIPLSMFLSFLVLSIMGSPINMIVLFGLILALGMLVDNAIVVVENIYRFVDMGYPKFKAAKWAVGEVAVPIIASTATTLAAFFPLLFWDSVVGIFMYYLPVTLIIVLVSSLFVALVIIPVISSTFISPNNERKKIDKKRVGIILISLITLTVICFILKWFTLGNLLLIAIMISTFNALIFNRLGIWFQNNFLVYLENIYLKLLRFSISKSKPYIILGSAFFLLVLTILFLKVRQPKVVFFPSADPSYINIKAELPIGTDIKKTDAFMKQLYQRVCELTIEDTAMIKSIVTNVGTGAKTQSDNGGSRAEAFDGLITISFKDYLLRNGRSTRHTMEHLSKALLNQYPGVNLSITKNADGPPTGKPINIEIIGKDYADLIRLTDTIQALIEAQHIAGIEGLHIDLDLGKPEMQIDIDREQARRFGMSTGMIASTLRTALFGKEISDYKDGENEYPIQLRLKENQRYSVSDLMNQKIVFMNRQGQYLSIPVASVASFRYTTTYGAIQRKDLKRVITIFSNVIEGYNANEINAQLKQLLAQNTSLFKDGMTYKFTGEQEEQAKSMRFLLSALFIAIALILIILVSQFNSLIKPIIILSSVLLSTIGVFGGIATFGMNVVVVMTGIGIVSLAGVVVNNAIVLIDYIDLLKSEKRKELGLPEEAELPIAHITECIIQGGKTRLRPVLLTAITTILGLLPMALGVNINFRTLLQDFDPQFSFGGDMADIWSPLSWTVIFGLSFATFLTLIVVPVMYKIASNIEHSIKSK